MYVINNTNDMEEEILREGVITRTREAFNTYAASTATPVLPHPVGRTTRAMLGFWGFS